MNQQKSRETFENNFRYCEFVVASLIGLWPIYFMFYVLPFIILPLALWHGLFTLPVTSRAHQHKIRLSLTTHWDVMERASRFFIGGHGHNGDSYQSLIASGNTFYCLKDCIGVTSVNPSLSFALPLYLVKFLHIIFT